MKHILFPFFLSRLFSSPITRVSPVVQVLCQVANKDLQFMKFKRKQRFNHKASNMAAKRKILITLKKYYCS